MGAALSAIGRSTPSFATSRAWLASPTTTPSRRTRVTGLSTGFREWAFTITKTSSIGRPRASPADQPVRVSATPLRNVTRPRSSVATTPSPMLASVVRRNSCSSRKRRSAAPRAPCRVPTSSATTTKAPNRTASIVESWGGKLRP
jgi:hypothetical protein